MASDSERPSSGMGRGVQITEFPEGRVNPEPVVMEESDLLLEDFLSPRKLKALTGEEELERVENLKMTVDTRDTSLGNFGVHLPNLSELDLSGSIVATIRDLGSSLGNVTVLWMPRCGLEDLDGIASLVSLRELYLAFNEVCDIGPCSMLDNVRIIDLEGNNICDASQIEFLAMCENLVRLTLEGNPVCVTPQPDKTGEGYDYVQCVKRAIPHLQYLDDQFLEENPRILSPVGPQFQEDWKLIDELQAEGDIVGSDDSLEVVVTPPGRPRTAIRLPEGYRPGSAVKPSSAQKRPGTGFFTRPTSGTRSAGLPNRPGSSASARPGSATQRPHSEPDSSESSLLTKGPVVCGGIAKALMKRKRTLKGGEEESPVQDEVAKMKERYSKEGFNLERKEDDAVSEEVVDDALRQELEDFKIHSNKLKEQYQASKAPQILKIDHDDAIDLSDDDEEVDDEDDTADVTAEGKADSDVEEDGEPVLVNDLDRYYSLMPELKDTGARPLTNQSTDSGAADLSGRSSVSPASRGVDLATLKFKPLAPIGSQPKTSGNDESFDTSVADSISNSADGPMKVVSPKEGGNKPLNAVVAMGTNRVSRGATATLDIPMLPTTTRNKKLANFQLLPSKYGK